MAYTQLTKKVGYIRGSLDKDDLFRLKGWLLAIQNDTLQDSTLIIDSGGGLVDMRAVQNLIQVPMHIHVAGKAESFAALLFLAGSYKTMSHDSHIMLHKARWLDNSGKETGKRALFRAQYRIASVISTIIPAPAKQILLEAVTEDEDVYVSPGFLKETGTIDNIITLRGEELGLAGEQAVWYNKKYNMEI